MANLVEKIISDPNSSFRSEDAEELSKLPQDLLQRLAIGLQTNAEPVAKAGSHEADLREDLRNCQQDIMELIATEQSIREELESISGEHQPSVLEDMFSKIPQEVAVANAAPTEQAVMDFVEHSNTVTAEILREAMAARDEGRKQAIETIMSASPTLYTENELKRKFTPELRKLAEFVNSAKPVAVKETTVYNWDGMGLADRSITTPSGFGVPLEIPSTLPERFQ